MGSTTRHRAVVVVAIGALSLVAFAGATALAGKGLKTTSETVTVDPVEIGAAAPTCKRGTKAVSGGFEGESNGPTSIFDATQSRRTGPREWTGAGLNNSLDPGELTAYAYCRDEKLKATSARTSVEVGELGAVTAECKPGQKAFSGGFALDEYDSSDPLSPILVMTRSLKEGKRKWTASAYNLGNDFGTTQEGDLTAYVYCREGKVLKTRQAEGTLVPSEFGEAAAKCKRRQRVVSGGFDLESDWKTTRGFIIESRKRGKRNWEIAAFGGPLAEHPIVAYAYCEKKKTT